MDHECVVVQRCEVEGGEDVAGVVVVVEVAAWVVDGGHSSDG